MRARRIKTAEEGNPLAGLRAGDAGPDPHFRAVLRARLVTAAANRGEDCPNHGRATGRGEAVD